MSDEPEDLAKAIILEFASKTFEKDPHNWLVAGHFHEALREQLAKYGYDTLEKTDGLLQYMAERNQLRKMGYGMYVISAKGREDLSTIYNDEWVSWKISEGIQKKRGKERKEKELYDLEERRHQDLVKAAREGNKIQKYGVWIAMALGAAGLIVAIFKP